MQTRSRLGTNRGVRECARAIQKCQGDREKLSGDLVQIAASEQADSVSKEMNEGEAGRWMDRGELVRGWEAEEGRPFTGWDFSYLHGRMIEDQPPWSYPARAAELMQQSSAVLDMGTGGGERLLELREDWPEKVVVTEDYPPNLELAEERLGRFGVKVVRVSLTEDDLMPFLNGEFDLVLNRHSGLNCSEVARILAPGGVFLTQQVHGLWAQHLLAEFGPVPQWPDSTPEYYVPRLKKAGLDIAGVEEWQGDLIFRDIGALVYYLRAVPWLVPDFAVENHTDNLLKLHRRLERDGQLVFEARKYLIEGVKVDGF